MKSVLQVDASIDPDSIPLVGAFLNALIYKLGGHVIITQDELEEVNNTQMEYRNTKDGYEMRVQKADQATENMTQRMKGTY